MGAGAGAGTMSALGSPARAYDFLLKFLLVGDSDVGKVEILASLQDGAAESPYGHPAGERGAGEERDRGMPGSGPTCLCLTPARTPRAALPAAPLRTRGKQAARPGMGLAQRRLVGPPAGCARRWAGRRSPPELGFGDGAPAERPT